MGGASEGVPFSEGGLSDVDVVPRWFVINQLIRRVEREGQSKRLPLSPPFSLQGKAAWSEQIYELKTFTTRREWKELG